MMGENLVVFYKQRLRKEHKQAFFAAFFIGLLVHIYKFTNDLPNNDTVFYYFFLSEYCQVRAVGAVPGMRDKLIFRPAVGDRMYILYLYCAYGCCYR